MNLQVIKKKKRKRQGVNEWEIGSKENKKIESELRIIRFHAFSNHKFRVHNIFINFCKCGKFWESLIHLLKCIISTELKLNV